MSADEDVRRRAEEAERRAHEAEERLRRQSLRAAEHDHKIKTDLTVILGWSDLLMEMSPDAEHARSGLEAIRRSASRIVTDAEQRLAEVRAEMSTDGLAPEQLDLSEILRCTIGDWSTRPGQDVNFAGREGVGVWADPGALQQVIGHLVDNAIRHSPAGTRVILSCHPVDDLDTTELEVVDEGPGIPEGVDLFTPFRPIAPGAAGGGLGLFVVHRLVEGMSGTISAERRAGGGSRFAVRLPARAAAARATPAVYDLTNDIVTYSDMPCLLFGGGRLTYANPAGLRLLGMPWAELMGRSLSQLPGQGWAGLGDALERAAHRDRAVRRTVDLRESGGEVHHFQCAAHRGHGESIVLWMLETPGGTADAQPPGRKIPGAGSRGVDRAPTHQGADIDLTDTVTGLPNRRLALDRLGQSLARARRAGLGVGVLFVDVDGLAALTAAYGTAFGDGVLAKAGRRLEQAIRPGDTVARPGGDDFVVVCEGLARPDALEAIAARIREFLAGPITVGGVSCSITATVGRTWAEHGSGEPTALIDAAALDMRRRHQLA